MGDEMNEEKKFIYAVTMEHVPTNEVRTFDFENCGPWEGWTTFYWEDGNMSCDCNRALYFFGRKEGDNYGCGDGDFLVISIKDNAGSTLYSEIKEG